MASSGTLVESTQRDRQLKLWTKLQLRRVQLERLEKQLVSENAALEAYVGRAMEFLRFISDPPDKLDVAAEVAQMQTEIGLLTQWISELENALADARQSIELVGSRLEQMAQLRRDCEQATTDRLSRVQQAIEGFLRERQELRPLPPPSPSPSVPPRPEHHRNVNMPPADACCPECGMPFPNGASDDDIVSHLQMHCSQ